MKMNELNYIKISEDKETTFEIKDISKIEMFYFVEKAYESIKRWGIRGENPKEHPLYSLIKWCVDKCATDFGGLTVNIRNFVTHLNEIESDLIDEIKKVEKRRLKEFPLYVQTKFEISNSKVFVELERKRKDSDDESVVKKVSQIIYVLNSRGNIMNAFHPLETSMKSYKKAFYVNKDDSKEIESISKGFVGEEVNLDF